MERNDEQPDVERADLLVPDQDMTEPSPSDDNSYESDAATTPAFLASPDESDSLPENMSSPVLAEADPDGEGSALQPASDPSDDPAPESAPLRTEADSTSGIELPSETAMPPGTPSLPPRDPHGYALPLERPDASENKPTPVEHTIPQEWGLPGDSADADQPTGSPNVETAQPVDLGQPMPRMQVFVMLADPYAALEQVVAQAAERMAPKFQQLAGTEVEHAEWVRRCEARAADYRLRGPR